MNIETKQTKSIEELLSPEILINVGKLAERIEILKSLIKSKEIIPQDDPLLQYFTENSVKSYESSLLEVGYKLINYYLSENIGLQEKIGSFKNLDERNLRFNNVVELLKFNEHFGMEFEFSNTTTNEGKIISLFKNPKIHFYEILSKPNEKLEEGITGIRYAGVLMFDLYSIRNFNEYSLKFYTRQIELPQKVKKLENIPEGTFFVDVGNNEFREAVCIENTWYVRSSSGNVEKCGHRRWLENRASMTHDKDLSNSLRKNPVSSPFRQMTYFYVDKPDEVEKTRNILRCGVYLKKHNYHSIPKTELSLDMLLENIHKLGIIPINKPELDTNEGCYKFKFILPYQSSSL